MEKQSLSFYRLFEVFTYIRSQNKNNVVTCSRKAMLLQLVTKSSIT